MGETPSSKRALAMAGNACRVPKAIQTPLHQLKGVAKQPSRNQVHPSMLVDTLMGDGENQEVCSGGISLASPSSDGGMAELVATAAAQHQGKLSCRQWKNSIYI